MNHQKLHLILLLFETIFFVGKKKGKKICKKKQNKIIGTGNKNPPSPKKNLISIETVTA